MNTNLLNIIKQIIAGNGEAVLTDPARLKAFFSDLAKDEPKPLRIAFGRCIEGGAYAALKGVADQSERAEHKALIVQRVHEEHGLDIGLCNEALDILEAALYAGKQDIRRCPSCGKELQEGWKACPYCGWQFAENRETPSPQVISKISSTAAPQRVQSVSQTAKPSSKKLRWVIIVAVVLLTVIGGIVWWTWISNQKDEEGLSPLSMVRVEGGTFQMGSNNGDSDEKPVHSVTVNSFYMANYPVTQKEWKEVMGSNPSYFKGDNLPVENVSWYDAVKYCNQRSRKEGLIPAYSGSDKTIACDWNASGYRLPTEAEWEYAAKGGNGSPGNYLYSGSNSVDSVAWYDDNSGNTTHPVGTKAPNSLGIYDMSGNVWEWCWDWYGSYSGMLQTNPRGASSGSYRVARGGGWYASAGYVRSADRGSDEPSNRFNALGFRLVRP